MKLKTTVLLVIITAIITSAYYEANTSNNTICSSNTKYSVFFCPEQECDSALISVLDSANTSIHAAVYSFTLDNIGDALVRAKQRGVDVKVIVEKTQVSKYSEYWKLMKNNITVLNDSNPDYMHDKFVIIDGQIVATGSYNWTKHATYYNNENLLIIWSKELAEKYEREFEKIFNKAISSL